MMLSELGEDGSAYLWYLQYHIGPPLRVFTLFILGMLGEFACRRPSEAELS